MNRDTILLLGGNGFIGTALQQRLTQERRPYLVIGRANQHALESSLAHCHTVIHLASSTTPSRSAAHPFLEAENIAFTLQLLEALSLHPDIHLIFFSSGGTVYGNPSTLPVSEEAPLAPISHYGLSKVAQEAFCSASRHRGHAVSIVRPANAYGPGQAFRPGFGLIRTLFEHLRKGEPIDILGDGETLRDYIYIDDLVEATLKLIDHPEVAETYNLGSGIGYSIREVITLVEAITQKTLECHYRPARSIDVSAVVLDTQKISRALNYVPKVSLMQGLSQLWAQQESL